MATPASVARRVLNLTLHSHKAADPSEVTDPAVTLRKGEQFVLTIGSDIEAQLQLVLFNLLLLIDKYDREHIAVVTAL